MTFAGLLIAHGSVLILPLSVIEGPVVTVLAGVLSARGYFSWPLALGLLVAGDLIGDLLYYAIGRTGRTHLGWLVRRGPTPALLRRLGENAGKMLVIGKWTQSLGCVVLIGGGMLRLPLTQFLLWNFLATLPKSAVLFALGYFGAGEIPALEDHWMLTGIGLGAAGLAALALLPWRDDTARAEEGGR